LPVIDGWTGQASIGESRFFEFLNADCGRAESGMPGGEFVEVFDW